MMPKETAKKLFLKHWKITIDKQSAKQCALITINEALKTFYKNESGYKYWQEVKIEIKKL